MTKQQNRVRKFNQMMKKFLVYKYDPNVRPVEVAEIFEKDAKAIQKMIQKEDYEKSS
jgi:hypothetical protein